MEFDCPWAGRSIIATLDASRDRSVGAVFSPGRCSPNLTASSTNVGPQSAGCWPSVGGSFGTCSALVRRLFGACRSTVGQLFGQRRMLVRRAPRVLVDRCHNSLWSHELNDHELNDQWLDTIEAAKPNAKPYLVRSHDPSGSRGRPPSRKHLGSSKLSKNARAANIDGRS